MIKTISKPEDHLETVQMKKNNDDLKENIVLNVVSCFFREVTYESIALVTS